MMFFMKEKKLNVFYLDFYFICWSDNDFFSHHDPAHPTIYVVVVLWMVVGQTEEAIVMASLDGE